MADDIDGLLDRLGLASYAPLFAENEIDMLALRHLGEADLRELGLPMGPRKKLLAAIAELEPSASGTPGAPAAAREAEHRQLTVMFVDLVGSTAIGARLDAEDLREIIRRFQNTVAGEVARYEGHVAKFMGDGVLVYFGYPEAHEDDAERAVRTARSILAGLESETVAGESLAVRIGVATGRVVVGDLVGEGAAQEEAVIGETPNLAARLQEAASPNSVVVAPATRELLGNLFDLEDLGERRLKGFDSPVRCWRVLAERPAESRFEATHEGRLSRFVGRDHELALLAERWFRAREGEGQVALLTGEAGIGKSRMTGALMERLAGEPHTRLRYQCSPHHVHSFLHPFIAQLELAAGFAAGDSAEAKRDKLEALLRRVEVNVGESLPLIAALLSLPTGEDVAEHEPDPQRRKQRTFGALLGQLAGLSARQPVLVIFEDAHWADPTSLELLEQLVDRVRDLPILVLVTGRPEFNPAWPGQAHVTRLTLNRLGRRPAAEIVADLTGGKTLPEVVLDQIVARTDGVPLFVEELTKTVLETGLLEDAGDHFELKGELPSLSIPSTLQDSLMARLDRLAPVKEVAQIGAAIGREFPHRLLARISSLDDRELAEAFDQLVEAGLLFRRGGPPEATYIFKHALVQDTAYASLLRGRRQAIHQRIAAILTAENPERAEHEPELLAHHYTEGGLSERALPLWLRAGRRAAGRSADVEAFEHLRKALRLLRELPAGPERDRLELEALIALGPVLANLKGSGSQEVRETYSRARELCDLVGDPAQRFPVLWGLWIHHNMAGKLDAALELAHEALALAETLGNEDFLIQAHHAAWTAQQGRADYAAVVEHADRGLALYDVERHRTHAFTYGGHDPGICAALQSGIASWFLGYPDRAVERGERALGLAPAVAHSFSTAHTLVFVATIYLLRREPEQAIPLLDDLIPFSDEHELNLWRANGVVLRSWALAELGHASEVLDDFRKGIEQRMAAGSRLRLPLQLSAMAHALARAGEADEATVVIDQALEEMTRTGERTWESLIHWVKGQVLAAGRNADLERAAVCCRQAHDIAQRREAKSMELRAATSLAGWCAEDGRKDEARELLAPVYEWFTEGFDTPDLEDARALLERLG